MGDFFFYTNNQLKGKLVFSTWIDVLKKMTVEPSYKNIAIYYLIGNFTSDIFSQFYKFALIPAITFNL